MLDRVDPRLGGDAHPAGAVRVRGDPEARLVRLRDRGGGLVERELRYVRWRALAEDSAGREDLDHRRAGVDLLAHGPAHLVRTIGDPADLEAMAARGRDSASGGDEPRALDGPVLYPSAA